MNIGIIVSNMIRLLEDNGYKTNINFFELSGIDDEIFFAKVKLKNPSEKFDLSSSYFPMCHPSFIRRIMFALKERTNFENIEWTRTYGRVINGVKGYIDVSEDDIVIGQPDYIDVYGDDLIEDTVSMLNRIDLCKYIAPGKIVTYDKSSEKVIFADEEKGYSKHL